MAVSRTVSPRPSWSSPWARCSASPPSWLMPTSNETRVRVEALWKIIPSVLPAKREAREARLHDHSRKRKSIRVVTTRLGSVHPAGASSEILDDALAAAFARHLTPAELCDITCALLHRRLAVPVAVWVQRNGELALCEQRGQDWIVERRARVDEPGAVVQPLGAAALLVAGPGAAEHAGLLQSSAVMLSDALGGEPPDTG